MDVYFDSPDFGSWLIGFTVDSWTAGQNKRRFLDIHVLCFRVVLSWYRRAK